MNKCVSCSLHFCLCVLFCVSYDFIFAVNCVLRDYDSENKLLFSLPPFVSESNHSILPCGPNFTRCFGDLLISSGALCCAQERNLGVCWDFSSGVQPCLCDWTARFYYLLFFDVRLFA